MIDLKLFGLIFKITNIRLFYWAFCQRRIFFDHIRPLNKKVRPQRLDNLADHNCKKDSKESFSKCNIYEKSESWFGLTR